MASESGLIDIDPVQCGASKWHVVLNEDNVQSCKAQGFKWAVALTACLEMRGLAPDDNLCFEEIDEIQAMASRVSAAQGWSDVSSGIIGSWIAMGVCDGMRQLHGAMSHEPGNC